MAILTKQRANTASEQLLNMWLHGKSLRTADYYRRSALRFQEFVGKPIHLITLAEVQGFALSLEEKGLSASTQRTIMAAVKSLLSFGVKIGHCIMEYEVRAFDHEPIPLRSKM